MHAYAARPSHGQSDKERIVKTGHGECAIARTPLTSKGGSPERLRRDASGKPEIMDHVCLVKIATRQRNIRPRVAAQTPRDDLFAADRPGKLFWRRAGRYCKLTREVPFADPNI